jgi:membrane fusion protein (multidrug efflux system)
MAIPFSRSLRALEADSYRLSGLTMVVALVLAALWSAWFFAAPVLLYEVSEEARIEVREASHPVEAPVEGRIVETHVALGKRVEVGDLLLELEARTEELELAEERSGRESSELEASELLDEIASEEQAVASAERAGQLELRERQAQFREAQANEELAGEELKRIRYLNEQGLKSDVDLLKAESELKIAVATSERLEVAISRREEELGTGVRDRRSRLESLQRQLRSLRGDIQVSESAEERLGVELEKRFIRAAIAGTLGEVAEDLRKGTFVEAGDKLCAIVPSGDAHIVAEFSPGRSLGRIRPGQHASLRLDGYPWTQYGVVKATVSRVGSEVRDGSVRVELTIEEVPAGISLEHGLPGELEVEVEAASPAILVLRSVGRLVEGA